MYLRVCNDQPLYTAKAIDELEQNLKGCLKTSNLQGVVRQLSKRGLISSEVRGVYRNEDRELLAWIRYRNID